MSIELRKFRYSDSVKNYFGSGTNYPTFVDKIVLNHISTDGFPSYSKEFKNEFDNLTEILEKNAAKTSPDLLAHFESVIGQRIANQQKWAGDIDYLEYAKKTDEHKNIKKHRELEIQILSDNLRDQESGARQWPR